MNKKIITNENKTEKPSSLKGKGTYLQKLARLRSLQIDF